MRKIALSITLALFSGIILFSGCQSGRTTAAPEVLAEFDFLDANSTHIILPIEFKGQTYRFWLDTGATHTIYDDSFKEKLGKPFLWPLSFTSSTKLADGREVKGKFFYAPNANLGPLQLNSLQKIVVFDLDVWPFIESGTMDVQGVIGMDFLKKYIVQIDYDNKKVTFMKGHRDIDIFSFLKPKENKHPEWGQAVPLKTKLFSDRSYYVKGNIYKDINTSYIIDSGWGISNALDDKILEKIDSRIEQEIKDVNIPTYIVIPLSDNTKILESFSVGTTTYNNNRFVEHDYSILGQDFLSRHIVTFDFPNKIMYLKEGSNFDKRPDIPLPLGWNGCVISSRNYAVTKVDPNSLGYEKGIRENDILTSVNNQDISEMGVTEFLKFLMSPSVINSDKNSFTFKRDDETFIVEFTIVRREVNQE